VVITTNTAAMPFRPEHSLLNLNLEKMHTIDTRSVENLFGLWAGKLRPLFNNTPDLRD